MLAQHVIVFFVLARTGHVHLNVDLVEPNYDSAHHGAIKGLALKKRLGKKLKQNRQLPHWVRIQTDNKLRDKKNHIYEVFFVLCHGVEPSSTLMGNAILFPAPGATYTVDTESIRSHLVWIPEVTFTDLTSTDEVVSRYAKCCNWRSRRHNFRFPALWFSGNRHAILLYFHGNSTDLGDIFDEMFTLSKFLDCNVLAIEYPGYGVCGKISVDPELINRWGLAAVCWLLCLGAQPESIIVFGRSIGTGPAARTAMVMTQYGYQPGGLILHSPFLSIHKIVSDYTSLGTWVIQNYWDTEATIKALEPCTPLLVIHGKNDEVIPVYHGQELLRQYNTNAVTKRGFFPDDSPHNGYYIIDDLAIPIKLFFKSRVCFQNGKPLRVPLYDTIVPFYYSTTLDFSSNVSFDAGHSKDAPKNGSKSDTSLTEIKLFDVNLPTIKPNSEPDTTENLLRTITAFDDIPVTQFSKAIVSKNGLSAP